MSWQTIATDWNRRIRLQLQESEVYIQAKLNFEQYATNYSSSRWLFEEIKPWKIKSYQLMREDQKFPV